MAGWKFRGVTDALRRVEEYEKAINVSPPTLFAFWNLF
jgi:hypothetical protein